LITCEDLQIYGGATLQNDYKISLDNKVAVIMGGGRGIGRATANTLAMAGAFVVVVSRTRQELNHTVSMIQSQGGSACAIKADVSDWESMNKLAGSVEQRFGSPDILVVNAGVLGPVGDSWKTDQQAWSHNIAVNLTGAYYSSRAFVPKMGKDRQGTLIYISSGAAEYPIPGWSAYCVSKAGLEQFVKSLAAEITERNLRIRVHTLRPGIVDTDMQEQARSSPEQKFAYVERFRQYYSSGQLRKPDEPAEVIYWLTTPFAEHLHGQIIDIDEHQIRMQVSMDLGLPVLEER
jgi:NAD(P)-dependent dehydrogenase (short-subunit alcohol dehydrogenase family)